MSFLSFFRLLPVFMAHIKCMYTRRFTGDTLISCLEVHGELSEARSGAEQVAVRYGDIARCLSRARSVGVAQHVGVAAEQVRVGL